MQLDGKRRYRPTESERGDPVHYIRTIFLGLVMAGNAMFFILMKLAGDPLKQIQLAIALLALGVTAFAAWHLYKDAREAYRSAGSGTQTPADSRGPDAI